MKLNSLVTLVAACTMAALSFDLVAAEAKADKPQLTRAEKIALGEARRAAVIARHGGKVRNTANQRGKVVVINAQKIVDAKNVTEPMEKLASFLKIGVDVQTADQADPKDARALKDAAKANALLMIVACDKCSEPMMIAPDGAWAVVNVKALGDRNLDTRLRKEVVRAFAYLCGGVKSQYNDPMTAAVTDIRQLDLIETAELPVDVLMRIPEYLKTLGVTQYDETSYRSACKQGWAPAPTNDVQKAIWDEYHTIPTKGMKIEFDPAKGK